MQKRLRHRSAISTAVASIAALVAVLAVSSMLTFMLLGRTYAASGAASQRLSRADEKMPLRLSTVYHVPPILVVSNDGETPVTITRIYLDGVEGSANLLLSPGEKAQLVVGSAEKVAVEVKDWGIVVLETVKTPLPAGAGSGGGLSVSFRCYVPPTMMPIWFLAAVSGGTPPYAFTINYGDGSSENYIGHVMLKNHFYTALPKTASITVTDRNGDSASASLLVADQCDRSQPPSGGGGSGPLTVSVTCTVGATISGSSIGGYSASQLSLDCNFAVSGPNPPYDYSAALKSTIDLNPYPYTICSTGGTSSSNNFNGGCYNGGSLSASRSDPLVRVEVSVSKGSENVYLTGSCRLSGSGSRSYCTVTLSGSSSG
jgi:hypothetical protein